MQNLRDQLQKAGLVNKQQKHQAEQEKRRERKKHRQGRADDMAQARQRQAYEAKIEAQRVADRERAVAQRTQQEAKEKQLQIQHLIDYWKVPMESAGNRRWYFTTRHNTIKHLYVSEPVAAQLDAGTVAIVEHPDDPETPFILVAHEAAELIARLDPQYVRFHAVHRPSCTAQ